MASLALELRAWRKRHDITQAQAADLMQYSLTSYHRYERGVRVPPYRDMQRLRALMRDIDYGYAPAGELRRA